MNRKDSDMLEALLRSLMGESTNTIIPDQEKRGQRNLINHDVLPKEINWGKREQFEAMGIQFGEAVDDLFVDVVLPAGWKKESTDHNMWSKLIDDKGRERAMIFYKAAFYDRSAHLDISRRFHCRTQPVGGYTDNYKYDTDPAECVVVDCDTVIWTSNPLTPTKELPRYRVSEMLEELGIQWLNENYPNWEDPMAYWD